MLEKIENQVTDLISISLSVSNDALMEKCVRKPVLVERKEPFLVWAER